MSKSEITNIYGGVIPCFKSNYPEFVKAFGYEVADECMEKTFGRVSKMTNRVTVPRRTQGGA